MPLKKPAAKKPAKKPAKRARGSSSQESAAQRRALFVQAYLANGHNATQAAITAGYSPATAHSQGSRLLSHVEIQEAVKAAAAAAAARAELTTHDVLRQLRATLLFDPRRLVDPQTGGLKALQDLDDETAAALTSIEVDELFEFDGKVRTQVGVTKKVKWLDKNAAREQAMKHFGLYERDNEQARERVKVLVMPGGKDAEL